MNKNSYTNISAFGGNAVSDVNNPLTYCMNNTLESRFLHGGNSDTIGKDSRSCQLYMSQYCAKGWDSFCESASQDTESYLPNNLGSYEYIKLTSGEILIRNTAQEKYLSKMLYADKKMEPFDPTVASSPMISYWVGKQNGMTMVPIYSVDPKTINDDPVMNKILMNPKIAFDILINIYNTMKREGTLKQLSKTKLGDFYNKVPYFVNKGGIKA